MWVFQEEFVTLHTLSRMGGIKTLRSLRAAWGDGEERDEGLRISCTQFSSDCNTTSLACATIHSIPASAEILCTPPSLRFWESQVTAHEGSKHDLGELYEACASSFPAFIDIFQMKGILLVHVESAESGELGLVWPWFRINKNYFPARPEFATRSLGKLHWPFNHKLSKSELG